MKKTLLVITIILSIFTSLLSACAGGGVVNNNWPGLLVDEKSNTAYVAYGQHIYAVDMNTGSEKWRFPSEANKQMNFYAAPVLAGDGQLIVAGFNNKLYSLNPENGQQNWQFPRDENQTQAPQNSNDHFVASVGILGDKIYAPNTDNNIYITNLRGEAVSDPIPTGDQIWGTPVTDGKNIYVASMDHHVYAIDGETNQQAWKSEDLGGAIGGTPAISSDGILYVGTLNSELIALDTTDGRIKWRQSADGWVWNGPTLESDSIYYGDLWGSIYAQKSLDGSSLWTPVQPDSAQKRGITDRPLLKNGQLYFGSESGGLFEVNAANGSFRSIGKFEGSFHTSPQLAGENILIAIISPNALLLALDTNGNQRWVYNPRK